jgi:pilus assembly protein Flp/PilA
MLDLIRFASRRLAKDEKGAALIEYTVLLGILVATVIASVVWTGTWVGGKWTTLTGTLSGN